MQCTMNGAVWQLVAVILACATTWRLPGCRACFCRHFARPSPVSRVSTRDGALRDAYGRTRLFHGINAVDKGPPWYPASALNATRLRLYREWGFNVVRLGAMWTGAQPQRDRFNDTYIRVIRDAALRMRDHDMHVILDMHQDVISSAFDSYDGVPRWVIDSLPASPHPYPWPLKHIVEQNWTAGYLTQAVGVAFQGLYDNVAGSRDAMAAFWTRLAGVFKHDVNVLGYELINEPWAGNIYARPSLLLPGVAGRMNLQPLYNALSEAIRHVDNETLIFYEPVTWGVVLNGGSTGTGFDSVPGGPAYRDRSVLAYHYYCWILNNVERTPGDGAHYGAAHGAGGGGGDEVPRRTSFVKNVCNKLLGPTVFASILADVRRLGGSSFLTEFGLCDATDACDFIADLADANLQSWTYWDTDFFDAAGHVRWSVVRTFARPYARAVAGRIVSMTFERKTRRFSLDYRHDGRVRAPTEVVVPAVHYARGFYVTVSRHLRWQFDGDLRVLYVTTCHEVDDAFPAEVRVVPFD